MLLSGENKVLCDKLKDLGNVLEDDAEAEDLHMMNKRLDTGT